MSYGQFKTISSVKTAFNLTIVESETFLQESQIIAPSPILDGYLYESLPIVATSGSEKARSEGIIYPLLLEVRRQLKHNVSLFSGEEFNVDESLGLNGICDFLLTRSTEVLEIEVPVIIVVEAKRTDLKTDFSQCIAAMVAAQRFNEMRDHHITKIYGSVSNGTQWQFLQLAQSILTIDLNVYPLPPVDRILGYLIWMATSRP